MTIIGNYLRHCKLKTRIFLILFIYSLILVLLFSVLVWGTSLISQDYVFNHVVSKNTERCLEHYRLHRSLPENLSQEIRAYIGPDDISPDLYQQLQLETLPEGLYENTSLDYHYTIRLLPGQEQKLYVIYDVSELGYSDTLELVLLSQLIIAAIITMLCGFFIGKLLSKRVMEPVSRLAERVRNIHPENIPHGVAKDFSNDEIGELAKVIDSAVHRLNEFISREREFTKNASHELRNPLAVIKNGAELLRSNSAMQTSVLLEPLGRIDRAISDMEQLVDTFLMLAREDDIASHEVVCDIGQRIERQLEKQSHLLSTNDIHFVFTKRDEVTISVPIKILDIILDNLVRNAIQYSDEGIIEFSLSKTALRITNKPASSFPGSYTYVSGTGHSIVTRLCDRLNWKFCFSNENDKVDALIRFAVE